MAYPKVKKLLKWDDEQIQAFIRQLCLRVEVIDISGVSAQVPTDRDDTPILATLIAAKADFLVSGDKDLLSGGSVPAFPSLCSEPGQWFLDSGGYSHLVS